MQNVNHSNRKSVQNCSVCDKPLYDDSKIQIGNDLYCQSCAIKILSSLENLSDKQVVDTSNSKIEDNNEVKVGSDKNEDIEVIRDDDSEVKVESGKDEDIEVIRDDNSEVKVNPDKDDDIEVIRGDDSEVKVKLDKDEYTEVIIEDNSEITVEKTISNHEKDIFENNNTTEIEQSKDGYSADIEKKYEKYLEDLYYDEKETKKNVHKTSLNDQLRDYEQKHGSITTNLGENPSFLKTDNVDKINSEKHDKINKLINKLDGEKKYETNIKPNSLNKTINPLKSSKTNEKDQDLNENVSLKDEILIHNRSDKNTSKSKNNSKLYKNLNNSYKEPKNHEEFNTNKNEDSLFIKIIILIILTVLIIFIIYYVLFLSGNPSTFRV